MQNGKVILVGARTVKEHVVVPFQLVKWLFRDRIAGVPVVYADDGSFMIFDPEGGFVHVLLDPLDRYTQRRYFSYARHPIIRLVQTQRITMMEMKMRLEESIADGLAGRLPDADELAHLLQLARFHENTQLRLKRFPLQAKRPAN